jgi:hypothetical protein
MWRVADRDAFGLSRSANRYRTCVPLSPSTIAHFPAFSIHSYSFKTLPLSISSEICCTAYKAPPTIPKSKVRPAYLYRTGNEVGHTSDWDECPGASFFIYPRKS